MHLKHSESDEVRSIGLYETLTELIACTLICRFNDYTVAPGSMIKWKKSDFDELVEATSLKGALKQYIANANANMLGWTIVEPYNEDTINSPVRDLVMPEEFVMLPIPIETCTRIGVDMAEKYGGLDFGIAAVAAMEQEILTRKFLKESSMDCVEKALQCDFGMDYKCSSVWPGIAHLNDDAGIKKAQAEALAAQTWLKLRVAGICVGNAWLRMVVMTVKNKVPILLNDLTTELPIISTHGVGLRSFMIAQSVLDPIIRSLLVYGHVDGFVVHVMPTHKRKSTDMHKLDQIFNAIPMAKNGANVRQVKRCIEAYGTFDTLPAFHGAVGAALKGLHQGFIFPDNSDQKWRRRYTWSPK